MEPFLLLKMSPLYTQLKCQAGDWIEGLHSPKSASLCGEFCSHSLKSTKSKLRHQVSFMCHVMLCWSTRKRLLFERTRDTSLHLHFLPADDASYNHRITWVGGDPQGSTNPTPGPVQDTLRPTCVQTLPEVYQTWDCDRCPGKTVQCLTTLLCFFIWWGFGVLFLVRVNNQILFFNHFICYNKFQWNPD